MRGEIRDADNAPIPGYRLPEAVDVFGNPLDGPVRCRAGTDVSALAGRAIRLGLVMRDGGLYCIRFSEADA